MITQPFNVDAYLGPYAGDATDEQKASLTRASEMVATRYPDDDSEQAMSGAAQIILGDTTIQSLADEYARAKRAEREAMARLSGGIIAASETASEVTLAQQSGLTRVTVRKALGK